MSAAEAIVRPPSVPPEATSALRERVLARDLPVLTAAVRERVGSALRGLVLLGGYGRGEGSVVQTPQGPRASNDYDLVVFVEDPRRWRDAVAALGHELTARVGVDVDLCALEPALLRALPRTLLWYDAAVGGVKILYGAQGLEESLARLQAMPPGPEERGRLLANRATGLALSRLEGLAADLPRMTRHVHKAVLACGDALLLAADSYVPGELWRAARLARPGLLASWLAPLADAYADAVRYRRRPDLWSPPRGAEREAWARALWPWIGRWHGHLEAQRRGLPTLSTASDFARLARPLYPELGDAPRGARLVAAARTLAKGTLGLSALRWHPRERLARVSVMLAYGPRGEWSEVAPLLDGTPFAKAPATDAEWREALLALRDRGA